MLSNPAFLEKARRNPKNLGPLIRELGAVPDAETIELINKGQAEFWRKYGPKRSDPNGPFAQVVGPFNIENRLVENLDLSGRVVIVSLACGRLPLLEHCVRRASEQGGEIVKFIGIDGDPRLHHLGLTALRKQGVKGEVIIYDLMCGLPINKLRTLIPKGVRIVAVVNWGLYFPRPVIAFLARQLFELGAESFLINQLTAGKFKPQVLAVRYLPFLARKLAVRYLASNREEGMSLLQVAQAIISMPWVIKFGIAMKKYLPIWSAREIEETIGNIKVIDVILWGQTTFMRATRATS